MIPCALPPPPAEAEDAMPVIPANAYFSRAAKKLLKAAIRFAEEMNDESCIARTKQLERIMDEAE